MSASLMIGAACAADDPVEPLPPAAGTMTVRADSDWAYVRLGGPAQLVQVADRAASVDWDVGFFATSVMLNGGAAGPGSVVGHCLCQNSAATNDQIQAMSAESEAADFDAVTAAHIPSAAAAWQSDALAPAIDGWFVRSSASAPGTADPSKVWKVRTAEGTAYAKFHVTALDGATATSPGRVTIEFATQPTAAAPMQPAQTRTLDLAGGPVYFDLLSGSISDASNWDLLVDGYSIRLNGGVSGSGQAGAVLVSEPFAAISTASDPPSSVFRADSFGGVFVTDRWYRYNITGTDRQVWPTYDVYLIKRGDDVYKVQLVGYYSPSGDARHITFRYAKLAP